MITVLRKIYALFNRRERRQLMLLTVAVVLMGLLEMVGVASIMPFMALAANPDLIGQNEWVSWLFLKLGFQSSGTFLFFLGVAVLAIIALGNAFTAFTTWAMLRFVWKKHDRLSVELLGRYLDEPYSFHLNRNSAALAKNVLAEVFAVINGVVIPGIQMLSKLVVVSFIVALLVWVDVVLAVIVGGVLGGAYGLVYAAVRGRQGRLGRDRVSANSRRYKLAGEAFGGIKDLKVMGRENESLRMYGTASRTYSYATASNAIVRQLPRYALETVAFGAIIIIVLYLLQVREDFGEVIPVLSLYAFAGYRLMPALQQVFLGLTQIRFNTAALDDLHEDLSMARGRTRLHAGGPEDSDPEALPFEHEIRLENVSYTYPEAVTPALREVSLVIPRNRTIGLVGATGSGKTTLADLILGLHPPTIGSILIDGTELDDATLPSWRKRLGYVPQQIFLSDDTVARNIAFGIPPGQIDPALVERAGRIAHIHDFVASLPAGYDTVVGERGVRLSGGQRQRIGVARALYHDPDILVMDEATSALDGATEDVVMEAIGDLVRTKTIVLIAHRLTTVRACDMIYLLDHGRVITAGRYEALIEASPYFRAMAGKGVSA